MQADRSDRTPPLLAQRILILDGAMGTMVQQHHLQEADYRGSRFADHRSDLKGDNDLLVLTQPELIADIHRAYLDAGADIIETNTFNATRVSQADYALSDIAYELNEAGARLARTLCDEFTAANPAKPRFCAGAIGPTSRTLSISPDVNDPGYRNADFDTLVNDYLNSARGLVAGGADLLLIETVFDTLNAKAAVFAVERLFEELGQRLPIMISGTITDASGRTLSGQTAEAFWNSLSHARPLTFGLNCALGAKELRQYVDELSHLCDCFVSAHPNAGLPNPLSPTGYDETPEALAGEIGEWARSGLRQHRRRLLRHHTRAHRRHRRSGCRRSAARAARHRHPSCACRDWNPSTLARMRCSSTSASAPMSPARKAFARMILEGRFDDALVGRAPAGRERRAGDRHQHGRGDARLAGRDGDASSS